MTDSGPPRPVPTNDNRPNALDFRLAESFLMGVRFFSRLPTGNSPHLVPDLDRMAPVLPFASFTMAIGPALVLLLLLWLGTPSFFAATIAIALIVIINGGMAEDALADSADGLFGGYTIDDRLTIMKDSRHGTYGVCAIVLLIALRITAIGGAPTPLEAAGILLAAPILARSSASFLTIALPPARSGGSAGVAGRVTLRNYGIGLGIAAVFAFVFAGFAVGILGLLTAALFGVLMVWGWITLCRRLIGGVTGDLIGAAQSLIEIAILTAFMIFI